MGVDSGASSPAPQEGILYLSTYPPPLTEVATILAPATAGTYRKARETPEARCAGGGEQQAHQGARSPPRRSSTWPEAPTQGIRRDPDEHSKP